MPTGIYKRIKKWKHSEETKKKMSEIHKRIGSGKHWKGKKQSPETIAKRTGKKHSIETRKKMSANHKGVNNPNWKGGLTKKTQLIRLSLEYRLWREAVFKRDYYTCVWCKQRGGNLEADHIKPFADYPELRFAIDNGRTLCKECHRKTDTFGRRTCEQRNAIL